VSADTFARGRYRVVRVLGDGAMGKVVLAQDGELDRAVAVKVLDEQLAQDASFRARFSREARVAASLSHPNIVTVFDVGEAEGRPFIVMEYIEGRTLDARLRDEGPLPADEVVRVGRQVAEGLEAAHANGLVHRDLKPSNLIEREDGTVKIADFGIARSVDATALTEEGSIVGTAAYLAPEQAEGGTVSHETDLFALGVVLYELLTGRQPWQVDSLAALAARREAPTPDAPPGTPEGLRLAIERSLEPEPTDRPSASEVVRLLGDAPAEEDATIVLPRSERARGLPPPQPQARAVARARPRRARARTRGAWDRCGDERRRRRQLVGRRHDKRPGSADSRRRDAGRGREEPRDVASGRTPAARRRRRRRRPLQAALPSLMPSRASASWTSSRAL
jgi:serine/threonine-protein kinase